MVHIKKILKKKRKSLKKMKHKGRWAGAQADGPGGPCAGQGGTKRAGGWCP